MPDKRRTNFSLAEDRGRKGLLPRWAEWRGKANPCQHLRASVAEAAPHAVQWRGNLFLPRQQERRGQNGHRTSAGANFKILLKN